jgi:hypothetical protein
MGRDIDLGLTPPNGTTGALNFITVRTLASPVTLAAAMKYIYQVTGLTRPLYFAGTFLSWDSGAWATAESVTVTIDLMVDGVNWENFWTQTYIAANAPLTTVIPNIVDADLRRNPQGFWITGPGMRVGIQQTVVGAGYHVVSHSTVEGK